MWWILFALLGPALYALANILDEHFSSNLFRKTPTLIFYASMMNFIFLPLVFFFGFPEMITLAQLPYFIILGLTGITYLYPYYKALQQEDTSIVISLFSLGRIFVPVLAFFFLGETLHLNQYIGFGIVIVSATFLTSKGLNIFKLNKSFFLMMICSLIIAIETIIYKSVFAQVNWVTGFSWAVIFTFIFAFPLLISRTNRADIKNTFYKFKKNIKFFIAEEFLSFGGAVFVTLALSLASVTIVKALGSFQPFFVLIFAIILKGFIDHSFKEDTSRKALLKKGILFVIMILGVILVLKPGIFNF